VPALALAHAAEPMAEEAGGTFVMAEDDPDEFVSATVLAETGHDPHDAHAAHAVLDASHGIAHAGDHGPRSTTSRTSRPCSSPCRSSSSPSSP
jgi:hypothetical protein